LKDPLVDFIIAAVRAEFAKMDSILSIQSI
jgi:hypothetical protein